MLAISAWLALSDALSGISGSKIDGAAYPGLDALPLRNGFCFAQTGLERGLSKGGPNKVLLNSWLEKVLSELEDGNDIVLATVTSAGVITKRCWCSHVDYLKTNLAYNWRRGGGI